MYSCLQCKYEFPPNEVHNGYRNAIHCGICGMEKGYGVIDEVEAKRIQKNADKTAFAKNKLHIKKNRAERDALIAIVLKDMPFPLELLRSIIEMNQKPILVMKQTCMLV